MTGAGSTRWGRISRALIAAAKHLVMEDGLVVAGNLAFTALFAIFPFLIFLLSLAGFVGQGAATQQSIELALSIMPAEVAAVLRPAVHQVTTGSTPGLATFGILLTLWFASSGLEGIRHALENAYHSHRQRRSFVIARLQSLALTILTAACLLAAIIAIVGGPFIRDALEWLAQRQLVNHGIYVVGRYSFGLLLLLGVTLLLHLTLPTARLRLWDVLPGSVLSVLMWGFVAWAYSTYLQALTRYNLTYGSLSGIVLTLFFFYISAAIFIFGAQFNGALQRGRSTPNSG
jgi:membrane protein